jgi:hypothetical protein
LNEQTDFEIRVDRNKFAEKYPHEEDAGNTIISLKHFFASMQIKIREFITQIWYELSEWSEWR